MSGSGLLVYDLAARCRASHYYKVNGALSNTMSTLHVFSEKEHQYHQYQARQEYLREQRTIQFELEQAKAREAAALKEIDSITKEKDAEIERLKALLAKSGH